MIRKLASILLMMSLVVAMTGCGSFDNSNPVASDPTSKGAIREVAYLDNFNISVSGNATIRASSTAMQLTLTGTINEGAKWPGFATYVEGTFHGHSETLPHFTYELTSDSTFVISWIDDSLVENQVYSASLYNGNLSETYYSGVSFRGVPISAP